jgi:hypothetical protein
MTRAAGARYGCVHERVHPVFRSAVNRHGHRRGTLRGCDGSSIAWRAGIAGLFADRPLAPADRRALAPEAAASCLLCLHPHSPPHLSFRPRRLRARSIRRRRGPRSWSRISGWSAIPPSPRNSSRKSPRPIPIASLTAEDLESLRLALTYYYVNHGYVTSGAVVPEQDVADGVLTMQIIEGKDYAGQRRGYQVVPALVFSEPGQSGGRSSAACRGTPGTVARDAGQSPDRTDQRRTVAGCDCLERIR